MRIFKPDFVVHPVLYFQTDGLVVNMQCPPNVFIGIQMFGYHLSPKSFKAVVESALSCWRSKPIFPATHPEVDPNPQDIRLLAELFQSVHDFNFTASTGLAPEEAEA